MYMYNTIATFCLQCCVVCFCKIHVKLCNIIEELFNFLYLQVDPHIYTDHLEPYLSRKGYRGSYVEKGTRNVIFFKENCFKVIDEEKVDFAEILSTVSKFIFNIENKTK